MAKKLLGPWGVIYPVNFYSGGDTTSQAFGKHIQEIARIYGLLNALDAGKAGSDEIAEGIAGALGNIQHNSLKGLQGGGANQYYHLTAAQIAKIEGAAGAGDIIKQHNSLQGIQGGDSANRWHLTSEQVSAVMGLMAISGNTGYSQHNKLQGLQGGSENERYHLTAEQANGIQSLLDNPVQAPTVFDGSNLSFNGYALFSNGLLLNWGSTGGSRESPDATSETITFPMSFTAGPWAALASTWAQQPSEDNDWQYQVSDVTANGMKVWRMTANRNTATLTRAHWLAIGKGK